MYTEFHQSILDLSNIIIPTLKWVAPHSLIFFATLNGLVLAIEPLLFLFPAKDPRSKLIASLFKIDAEKIIPIVDGLQLWHDTHSYLHHDRPCDTMPLGSPTFRASYLLFAETKCLLVCVHSTENLDTSPAPNAPHQHDAIVTLMNEKTTLFHSATLNINADEDCVRRTNLIETYAHKSYKINLKPIPIVLWKDPLNLAPDPDYQTTLSGLAPLHMTFKSARVPNRKNDPDTIIQSDQLKKLKSWILYQPTRQTTNMQRWLRHFMVLIMLFIIAKNNFFTGHSEIQYLITILKTAINHKISL